jgi:hypothetical protein
LAGNEKKKTDGKTTNHEKKKTPNANKEKDHNKVVPRKIKLKKKNDGEGTDSYNNELLKKTISCSPWNNKREGNAWQQR